MSEVLEPQVRVSTNGKHRGKLRLITRKNLDGRTRAVLAFDAIVEDHVAKGADRDMAEAYAGAVLNVRDLNARRLSGEKIDSIELNKANSSLIRLASKLKAARAAPPSAEKSNFLKVFEEVARQAHEADIKD